MQPVPLAAAAAVPVGSSGAAAAPKAPSGFGAFGSVMGDATLTLTLILALNLIQFDPLPLP